MEKRVYELVVLLPEATDEKKAADLVFELLGKSGGRVLKSDFWGKKQLVYPVKKQNRAAYGYFEIEMDRKGAVGLVKRIKLNDEIIRHLLVVSNQKMEEKTKSKTKKK